MNISFSSVALLSSAPHVSARAAATAGAETCGAELSRAETFSAGS